MKNAIRFLYRYIFYPISLEMKFWRLRMKFPHRIIQRILIAIDNFDSFSIGSGSSVRSNTVINICGVVTKDVPEYAIVAGNPAKILKYRE